MEITICWAIHTPGACFSVCVSLAVLRTAYSESDRENTMSHENTVIARYVQRPVKSWWALRHGSLVESEAKRRFSGSCFIQVANVTPR